MKPKSFAVLVLAAAASLVIALATYASNNPWTQAKVTGALLFPALAGQSGSVARIEITQGPATLAVARQGNGWVLASQGNYPAKPEAVRSLLAALSVAELVDPKTALPDRLGLLELEDPKRADAKSRLVRLLDDKGAVLAQVIVGKKRWDAFGASKGGTYLRRPDENQSWLSNVSMDASSKVRDWVQPAVLNVDASKVKAVTIEMPGQPPLKIEREAGDKGQLKLLDIPADKKLKSPGDLDSLARAATSIDLEDVRKAADKPAGEVSVVKIAGGDGLDLTLRLRKEGADAYWVTVAASGQGDAQKTADEIKRRTEGWDYKIESSKAQSILKTQADLVESNAPAPPQTTAPPRPGLPKR